MEGEREREMEGEREGEMEGEREREREGERERETEGGRDVAHHHLKPLLLAPCEHTHTPTNTTPTPRPSHNPTPTAPHTTRASPQSDTHTTKHNRHGNLCSTNPTRTHTPTHAKETCLSLVAHT